MSRINAEALLDAWEAGSPQSPARRAITLLAAIRPGVSTEQWLDLGIGQRDGHLIALREALFGPRFEATATCPQCGERLELAFSAGEICVPAPDFRETYRVELDGYEVEFRLPVSRDLLELAESAPESRTQDLLLKRCLRSARQGDEDLDPARLPSAVLQAVAEAMAKADPQADIEVALSCPACRHSWALPFDILTYLWGEIEDWARHLLREIHALASAYGWSERDILAMSARRRQQYLAMIGG